MNLSGPTRRMLAAAATVAGAVGLVVGLAGPAAAQGSRDLLPPAPPGRQWIMTGENCTPGPPPRHDPSELAVPAGRCPLGIDRGPGTRYDMYFPFWTGLSNEQILGENPDRPPVGHVDTCDAAAVHGWTKDPDWHGPLQVHVYNQYGLVKDAAAGDPSELATQGSLQRFAVPHDQPPGTVLTVYAIGREFWGGPNGVNPALSRSDGTGVLTCVVP